ncbi:hypothetical protein PT7_2485 [Pusillimonas sp. T7-7]|nr:hypothetical protein PT7_2485 [Pusillimonas sp. T7-7]
MVALFPVMVQTPNLMNRRLFSHSPLADNWWLIQISRLAD